MRVLIRAADALAALWRSFSRSACSGRTRLCAGLLRSLMVCSIFLAGLLQIRLPNSDSNSHFACS